MKKSRALVAVALAAVATGCAMPMTPAQYRSFAARHTTLITTKSFTVNRPLFVIARTFHSEGPRCLDKTLISVSTTPGPYGPETQRTRVDYHADLKMAAGKVQLAVQRKWHGTITIGSRPKKGAYMMVVDVKYMNPHETRVHMYYDTFGGAGVMVRAVKGWLTGNNVGCPDLGQ